MSENANSEFVTVYVTVENEDAAVHMATALVKEKLVACANIKAGMRSIYESEGIIQFENEVLIFMKSRGALVEQIVARVKEMHSYQTPCVTVMPIIEGNPDYLSWVTHQTKNI